MKRYFLLTQERHRVSIAALFLCALVSPLSFALQKSMGPGGSNVLAVHAEGYKGQSIHIGFLSIKNVFEDHYAFLEKDLDGVPVPGTSHVSIDNILGINDVADYHDTQMAGIMISSGDPTEPNQIGAAPMAFLHNVRAVDDDGYFYPQDVLEELIVNQNCRVIVTGFQLNGTPSDFDGNSQTTLIYDYYAQKYNVVFANAAGNYKSDSYPHMTPPTSPGDAYNGITTGGLITTPPTEIDEYDKIGNSSLSGHTYDNRMKTDVTAPSSNQRVPTTGSVSSWTTITHTTQGFTSWSVPHTAGVAAVLLSYAEDEANTEPDDNKSEVIKAVIVNSTFPNIISKTETATTGLTWQADRGYGRLDALRAFETLSAERVIANNSTQQQRGWAFEAIRRNQTHTYTITGRKNQRLVATITWHRKLDSFLIEENPRFYVDMEVILLPSSSIISKPAGLDNLIKIDVLLDQGGQYQIVIDNAKQQSYRNYALAFELLEPLTADFDINYVVDVNDMAEFIPYWLETDCTSEPCSDYDLSDSNSIDLSDFSLFAKKWLTYDPRYYSP